LQNAYAHASGEKKARPSIFLAKTYKRIQLGYITSTWWKSVAYADHLAGPPSALIDLEWEISPHYLRHSRHLNGDYYRGLFGGF
jgi:hypothetical protein